MLGLLKEKKDVQDHEKNGVKECKQTYEIMQNDCTKAQ